MRIMNMILYVENMAEKTHQIPSEFCHSILIGKLVDFTNSWVLLLALTSAEDFVWNHPRVWFLILLLYKKQSNTHYEYTLFSECANRYMFRPILRPSSGEYHITSRKENFFTSSWTNSSPPYVITYSKETTTRECPTPYIHHPWRKIYVSLKLNFYNRTGFVISPTIPVM
jgi:hypothetical protein